MSGCCLINPGELVLPDDLEFIAVISELDTPEKICQYMYCNFEIEEHPYYNVCPYDLYLTKKGDCNDYSTFAVFVAHYHGYETYQIRISFQGEKYQHCIAVYKEDKYSFSDNGYYYNGKYNYNSFLEIVKYESYLREEKWLKYKVYDYDMNVVESNVQ